MFLARIIPPMSQLWPPGSNVAPPAIDETREETARTVRQTPGARLDHEGADPPIAYRDDEIAATVRRAFGLPHPLDTKGT